MQYAIEVTFHRTTASAALEARVFDSVSQLERVCDHITGCRVLIEGPAVGGTDCFAVQIRIRTPEHGLTIANGRCDNPEHRDVYAALRDAFGSAERELRLLELPLCTCTEPPRDAGAQPLRTAS